MSYQTCSQIQEGTTVTSPQTRGYLADTAALQPSVEAQAQNVQSTASQSCQGPKCLKCSKGKSKSSAATQSTHKQVTLKRGGGDAQRALHILTVFKPEPLNKDQYDIQGGNWKASAKGAPHALTQEGKKAVDIKADGNCWLAGPYKAMHPTVVYP